MGQQTQPESAPLSVLSAAELLPPDQEIHHHDHGGGRLYEGTLAEARTVCPVLARMSLQEASNALADAEMAERLALKGRQKRLTDTAAEQPVSDVEPAAAKSKSLTEKAVGHDARKPAAAKPADKPAAQDNLAAAALAEIAPPQDDWMDRDRVRLDAPQGCEAETILWVNDRSEAAAERVESARRPAAKAETDTVAYPAEVAMAYRVITRVPAELEPASSEPAPASDIIGETTTGTSAGIGTERLFDVREQELASPAEEVAAVDPAEVAFGTPDMLIKDPVELRPEPSSAISRPAELDTVSSKSVCENFAEALQVLMPPSVESVSAIGVPDVLAVPEIVAVPEGGPASAVVIAVSERLPELTPVEQEVVASILTEIAGALREALQPEAREGGLYISEPNQADLEELVQELFWALDIDPGKAGVRGFVQELLQADLRSLYPLTATEADLEHDGTHEAKWRFTQLASSLADAGQLISQSLGGFVLFHIWREQHGIAA